MNAQALFQARMVADNLALDFVNSSTGRNARRQAWSDYLTDAFEVLVWLRFAKAISEVQFRDMTRIAATEDETGAAFLRNALRLRGALSNIFNAVIDGTPPSDDMLTILNEVLTAARGARRLVWAGPAGLRAVETAGTVQGLDSGLWPIAIAAEELLTSDRFTRVKRCGSSTCSWVFLDTSKNGSRCWCQMEICGNREKGRRRLKRKSEADLGPAQDFQCEG